LNHQIARRTERRTRVFAQHKAHYTHMKPFRQAGQIMLTRVGVSWYYKDNRASNINPLHERKTTMKGTQKVTLSLPHGLLDEFREHAQMTNLSSFIAHAMRDEIRYVKIEKKNHSESYAEGYNAGFSACQEQLQKQITLYLNNVRKGLEKLT
jgi:hypothetical protein